MREVKRSTGRQVVRLAVDGVTTELNVARGRARGSGRACPAQDFAQLDIDQSVDPETILRAALDRGLRVTQFLIADPSIEDIFIEQVGRRPRRSSTSRRRGDPGASGAATGGAGSGASGPGGAATAGTAARGDSVAALAGVAPPPPPPPPGSPPA